MDMTACRILMVDDETDLLELNCALLAQAGFQNIDTAKTAGEAEEKLRTGHYQLVILDVNLPDRDGFSLFESWQAAGTETPVIFLSARDGDQDRLKGLGLGADDYIVKPFLPEELVLRVRAVLRRSGNTAPDRRVRIGKATVDFSAGILIKDGQEIELTAKEYQLLKELVDHAGKIVPIGALLDALWPDGSYGYENSLMVHVRRLREKLEDNPSAPVHLLTVRGLGYKLKL